MKTKILALQGKKHIKCNTAIENRTTEQVKKEDINIKLHTFQRTCRMIRRTLRQKTSQITQIKFCKIEAVSMLTYANEN